MPATSSLSQTNFTSLDWAIVVGYLMATVVIGLCVKQYVKNMTDYIGAGRALGTCIGIATLSGTEMGLITVMYCAQKGFVGGFAAFHIALAAGVVTFFVGLTGFIICRLREMKVLTIPEYYGIRFGTKTRLLGGIMLAAGGILNMGLFLQVGAKFIVGITGLSSIGWALPVVMTSLLVLMLAYTVMGGMIAVVITDYLQFVVLSFGIMITTLLAITTLGFDNIFETVTREMGEKGFNPFISEGEFGLEYVMWVCFLGLVGCAIWPTAVARALAAESTETVRKQFMWSSLSYLIRFLVPYFWGICAFVYLMNDAPKLGELFFPTDAGVEAVDNLYAMPIFLGRVLPTGLIGITSAGMIAAFMSTHDSYLLCWSSVITRDIVEPLLSGPLKPKHSIRLTRIWVLLIGLYILYWGIFYKGRNDIWDYMAVSGAVYFSGAFALLTCGMYWKRASSTGAVLSLLAGFSALFGLSPIQDPIRDILGIQDPISSARVGLFTIFSSVFAMAVGSLLFPDKTVTSDHPTASKVAI